MLFRSISVGELRERRKREREGERKRERENTEISVGELRERRKRERGEREEAVGESSEFLFSRGPLMSRHTCQLNTPFVTSGL